MSLSAAKVAYKARPDVRERDNAWQRAYRQRASVRERERLRGQRRRAAPGGSQRNLEAVLKWLSVPENKAKFLEYMRQRDRTGRRDLADRYILALLKNRSWLKTEDLPVPLLEVKRMHLIVHRQLKDKLERSAYEHL